MSSLPYEDRTILAFESLQKDPRFSLRAAAKVYNINHTTRARRRAGPHLHDAIQSLIQKFTKSKEEVIIEYAIKLSTRSFPPRLCSVEELANNLLCRYP